MHLFLVGLKLTLWNIIGNKDLIKFKCNKNSKFLVITSKKKNLILTEMIINPKYTSLSFKKIFLLASMLYISLYQAYILPKFFLHILRFALD